MTVQEKVKTALSGIGVPVFLGAYHGTEALPSQYVLFTTRREAAGYADDRPIGYKCVAYIEMWSAVNFSRLRESVVTAMQAEGFDLIDEVDVSEASRAHLSQTWTGGVDLGEI